MSATTLKEAKSALRAIKRFRTRTLNPNSKYRRVAPAIATEDTPTSSATTSAVQASPSTEIFNPFLPWKNPKTGRWANPQYSLRRQADLVKKAMSLGPDAVALLPPSLKMKARPLPSTTYTLGSLMGRDNVSSKSPFPISQSSPTTKPHSHPDPPSDAERKHPQWLQPVTWTGVLPPRTVRGVEVPPHFTRLYVGRRRMFKGHKWERTAAERMKKRKELLASMNRTVRKYKTVSP
jgi:large subunit ribosomal protein L25